MGGLRKAMPRRLHIPDWGGQPGRLWRFPGFGARMPFIERIGQTTDIIRTGDNHGIHDSVYMSGYILTFAGITAARTHRA